ncbi:MAG: hypothetical protein J0L93_10835 [Deltaproteobacteria bacterium]|nr:hypothetical protein [Deltaproteobacteria bacterium]
MKIQAAISEQQLLGEAYRMAKLMNPGDHAWALAEALASTTAVLLYLTQHDQIPLDKALLPAVASGVLSYGFQIFFPQYVRWVNQQGFFKISDEVKASFLSTLGKEYVLQLFYVGVVHLASVSMGIETLGQHFFDTAFLAWLGEGSFSLIIAKITERLPVHFPDRPKFAWNLGKASFFALGIWSSVLMISNLSNAEFSYYAYWIMSVVGIPAYFWMSQDLKEFRESLKTNFSKTASAKNLVKASYASATSFCRSTLMMLRPTRSPAFN